MFPEVVETKKEYIERVKPSEMKEYDGVSFTRVRQLMFGWILVIILRCSPYGLQIRLEDYYKEQGMKEKAVSKQAFSKARGKISPSIVEGSYRLTTKVMMECEDLEYYRGKYRLCAVDGSDVSLNNAAALLEQYGGAGRGKDCAMASCSLCYDPLNNIILDGVLKPYGTSEREMARLHFEQVESLVRPEWVKNLYINDRGYPSKEFFAEMIEKGLYFLMRVRRKFSTEFDSITKSGAVKFIVNGKKYKVRVFHVTLDSGETEILVSNLPRGDLKRKEIAELYFKRWGIETKFDSLKNKLELENWSGRRPVTVEQDFWAKLDIANTLAALEWSTNDVIEENTANSNNKYAQTTNENRLISKFSDAYISLLTKDDPGERLALFNELIYDIARRPVEVKPGRKSQRKPPRKKKFCDRRKRSLR